MIPIWDALLTGGRPHTGAWIEMPELYACYDTYVKVAPRGAWIEIILSWP